MNSLACLSLSIREVQDLSVFSASSIRLTGKPQPEMRATSCPTGGSIVTIAITCAWY